jgi:hypothetical protein
MMLGFSISLAAECAQAAELSYDYATIESDLAHVLIVESDDFRLVNFRGTNNPLDWFTDAKIRFVEYPKGSGLYVHAGFNESMLSVRERVLDRLRSLPNRQTIIGGHSKGAGEARQLIFGLDQKTEDEIGYCGSYAFGEPRSLGRKAALAYDQRHREDTVRLVHEEDFVARIPWLCGQYRHAGHEALLSSLGGCVVDPSPLALICSNSWGMFKAWEHRRTIGLIAEPLKDHFIANYRAALPLATAMEKTVPV